MPRGSWGTAWEGVTSGSWGQSCRHGSGAGEGGTPHALTGPYGVTSPFHGPGGGNGESGGLAAARGRLRARPLGACPYAPRLGESESERRRAARCRSVISPFLLSHSQSPRQLSIKRPPLPGPEQGQLLGRGRRSGWDRGRTPGGQGLQRGCQGSPSEDASHGAVFQEGRSLHNAVRGA